MTSKPKISERSVEVRFSDLDPYGHVNHSVYLTYFELGRTAYLQDNGSSLIELADDGIRLVVAEITVSYSAAIKDQSHIKVVSTIGQVGASFVVWKQELVGDSTSYATAEVKVVAVNQAGRPTRFPKQLIN